MHLVNVSFPACLAPFTEEILNGKLIFFGQCNLCLYIDFIIDCKEDSL